MGIIMYKTKKNEMIVSALQIIELKQQMLSIALHR